MTAIISVIGLVLFRQFGLLVAEAPELIKKVGGLLDGIEKYVSTTFNIKRSITSQHIENQVSHLLDNSGNMILNSVGLYVLGIKYAFFFGFLAALLNLIPFVGVLIGSLLPALLALVTKDSYWYAVGAIGVMLFVQIMEGNLITPFVVGSRISINPLIVIFMFMLFGKLWGISGLVLALPLTAILKVLLDTIPACKAYCFILGEPHQYHLKRFSRLHVKLEEKRSRREKDTLLSENPQP